MTHPDAPRPPMSETVKTLTKEWREEWMFDYLACLVRDLASAPGKFNDDLYEKLRVFALQVSTTIADMEAKLAEAQRDLEIQRDMYGMCAMTRLDAEARAEKAERDLAQSGEMEWPALNDDLIAILGRPNFHCANVANILRKGGTSIPTKSEHEQAHTIHFLMGMYLKHGKDRWAKEAEKALRAIIGLPPPTTGSAP